MTNEQAKAEIMQIYGVLSPSKQQALDVALEALKQEPSGDAISRDAVWDVMQELWGTSGELIDRLMALPSVNPQEPIAQERYEDLCEYFGGVEDILKNRDDFKAWLGRVKWHIHKAEELYEKYEKESCEDCVNRREVFEQINCWIGSGEYRCTNATYYLTERVKHISHVTPQPKTGHWVEDLSEYDNKYPKHIQALWKCVECKENQVQKSNYCPNCGARMESEDDNT